ncbi:MAG TPA: bifunctional hydroxymethylpyrimidine kinase/phosphomethylpyrimidine kinase [Arenicellales bacterium]|nr:bifunctional hydroxymethylpyrimidine kinase/phosphomethylpyrimidine kinase [Arenicellales bacterium]
MFEHNRMKGRVLIVAGSDSGGGAGIQADIKTVTALGGYAATAITALTAQDTRDVHAVLGVEPGFIRQQMEVVLADIGADAIKLGMLHDASVIEVVCEVLESSARNIPVVADPVMVAKGGARLLSESAVQILRRRLLPLARIVTPNIPEAEVITDMTIDTPAAVRAAAEKILELGSDAVLLKGGHMAGETVTDTLVSAAGHRTLEHPRIDTTSTHGTGCTLASAIATGIAQGRELEAAVERAIDYVEKAIRSAPGFGSGHGPLDHAHTVCS